MPPDWESAPPAASLLQRHTEARSMATPAETAASQPVCLSALLLGQPGCSASLYVWMSHVTSDLEVAVIAI